MGTGEQISGCLELGAGEVGTMANEYNGVGKKENYLNIMAMVPQLCKDTKNH